MLVTIENKIPINAATRYEKISLSTENCKESKIDI